MALRMPSGSTTGPNVTSDPTPKGCSYADEVTEMCNVMLSLRSLEDNICNSSFSMEVTRLKGLATTDESDDAPPPEDIQYVLSRIHKDTQKILAEAMTFSMSPQRRQIQELVERQKLVANELKKNSSLAKSYRTHVDNLGTMHVLENDLTNPRLGELEHEFLMKILKAPRKHYIWKEAADQISARSCPGEPPLVREVLKILTGCLETTRLDQEKLDWLQNESCWKGVRLENWLPHTICRILGENVEDGTPGVMPRLLRLADSSNGEIYYINEWLLTMSSIGMTMNRDKNCMHKLLKHVPPFTLLIPMLSLQQDDIEGEIEYLRKKVENLDSNQD
ncbi:hypothetical protein GGI42DRAFT_55582 [Trichoderma sp. SZMC 28013]